MHIAGRTVIAAIDDALVPDCFTHLAVMEQGRVVRHDPGVFAAFAPGRLWRFRLRCPAAAESAAAMASCLALSLRTPHQLETANTRAPAMTR